MTNKPVVKRRPRNHQLAASVHHGRTTVRPAVSLRFHAMFAGGGWRVAKK